MNVNGLDGGRDFIYDNSVPFVVSFTEETDPLIGKSEVLASAYSEVMYFDLNSGYVKPVDDTSWASWFGV